MSPEAESIHVRLLSLDTVDAKTTGEAARMIREQSAQIERLQERVASLQAELERLTYRDSSVSGARE